MIFKFCQEQKWGTSQVRKCKQQPMKQWQQVPVGEKSIRGMCYWKCTSLWIVGLKESSTELEALKTQALECGIWACGLLRHRGEAHLGPSTTPLTGNTIFEQRCFHDWWVSIPYTLFFFFSPETCQPWDEHWKYYIHILRSEDTDADFTWKWWWLISSHIVQQACQQH